MGYMWTRLFYVARVTVARGEACPWGGAGDASGMVRCWSVHSIPSPSVFHLFVITASSILLCRIWIVCKAVAVILLRTSKAEFFC